MKMKPRLRYAPLALVLILLFSALGCALPSPVPVEDGASPAMDTAAGQNEPAADPSGTALVNVTDMSGRAVQMDAYPSRIIVLDPGDCEILCAIGGIPQLVGRTDTCDYPAEISAVPYVSMSGKPDPDLILLNKPDLVILSAENAQDTELLAALEQSGIPSVITNPTDINGLYTAVTLIGAVSNHVSEASSLVAHLLTTFAGIQAKVTSGTDTIYFELSPLADGLKTVGGGTLLNDVALLLGCHNEFEDLSGKVDITPDQVLGRGPSIIVTTAPASEDGTSGAGEILARSGWEGVPAVISKRVYAVDGDALTRSGPRLADAVSALYTYLYETPAN